jgi:DNA-binding LacI/PurR family transcriptional regulator
MLQVDPRPGVGIAVQISNGIALLIADGRFRAGDRLPSVRELAAQLGVNVNTVRAAYARLADDGLVETRQGVGTRVLAPASGRMPVGSRSAGTSTIAVLIAGLDPFYLPLLRGIEDVAAEHGLLVLIGDTRDSADAAETIIRRLVARGIAGVIAVSTGGIPPGRDDRRPHAGRVPPIVYVDQPDRKGHVLLFDGHGAGAMAVRHVLEHGHQRVGMVTASLAWANTREVYDGYAAGLAGAGLDVSPALVADVGEFSFGAGRAGLARLLDLPEPPTAVFAAGDVLAQGVLEEARARGLDIPRDLAIVGYTDSPSAALVEPPLTMVAVPSREIGERAMRTLAASIAGGGPRPRRVVLDVELVVRRSCGPHASS